MPEPTPPPALEAIPPWPHFEPPADPMTMPCPALADEIARVDERVAWIGEALDASDRRRGMARDNARHWHDQEHKAREANDMKAAAAHHQKVAQAEKAEGDEVQLRMALHDELARLQTWLTAARYQQATRCRRADRNDGSGPARTSWVAATLGAAVLAAAALGWLTGGDEPDPTPAAAESTADSKPPATTSTTVTRTATGQAGTSSRHPQTFDASRSVPGRALWSRGTGDCNTGNRNAHTPTGAQEEFQTGVTVVPNDRSLALHWQIPTGGPFMGPLSGPVDGSGNFELRGELPATGESWTYTGRSFGRELVGTFVRNADYGSPCTAQWRLILVLERDLTSV